MWVLTTFVMLPISHESILSDRSGPTWVNSVSGEECDDKCDKCPYKQHFAPGPGPGNGSGFLGPVCRLFSWEKCWENLEVERGDWRLGTTRHRNSHGEPGPDQARLYYSLPRPELRPCSRDSLEQANKINYINITLSTAKPGPLHLLIVG